MSSKTIPNPTPCLSFWQRTTRSFPLLHSRKSEPVPPTAKYVIVGSGIAGGLTAFSLLEAGVPAEDIVILEAREAASGASSRNAGHVRPDAFRGFSSFARVLGKEQARKVVEDERLVLQRVDEFVRKHNVPCDFHLTTTFDVCMTREFATYEAESLRAFQGAGGDISHIKFHDSAAAEARTGIRGALAAYEWPAGSSHPAKLAQFLLHFIASGGVRLFTFCPATAVSQSKSTSAAAQPRWDVHTPRGTVTASKVIHCTNAHAALLLPFLEPYITPNRAQAHSLIPAADLVGDKILKSTYSIRYELHHFYSLIQRQSDGTLILGISRSNPNVSAETRRGVVSTDDSRFNEEIQEEALRSFNKLFPEQDNEFKGRLAHGEGLDHSWTGIIAMTSDNVPFVGELESFGLAGQYVCAGFNGHGMARIFTCAPGVAKLAQDKSWSETGLPECFQISKERLSRFSSLGVQAAGSVKTKANQ